MDSHHTVAEVRPKCFVGPHDAEKSYYFRRGNIADDTVICYSWTEDAQMADDLSGQHVVRTLSLALQIVCAMFQNYPAAGNVEDDNLDSLEARLQALRIHSRQILSPQQAIAEATILKSLGHYWILVLEGDPSRDAVAHQTAQ